MKMLIANIQTLTGKTEELVDFMVEITLTDTKAESTKKKAS